VHQSWDANGHLASVEEQKGAALLSGLQYDADGALKGGHFGGNLTAYISYTEIGNIESLRIDRVGATIFNKNYSYTSDGSISNISDLLHAEDGFIYKYDRLQRVAGYSRANGENEQKYDYDAFGNLCISLPCRYDDSNRFYERSGIQYDASGNMTNDGRHSYLYDAEGRISQVDGGSVEYLYSAEGDRIQKRVGNDSTETVWVGSNLLAEQRPDGTWVDYLYVDGRRVAAIIKSDVTYYVSDPLGITRMELSSSGEILAQSYMTPFGQLINRRSGADKIPFTNGEQYDVETGLYSYKYRSYNPFIGRWMSPDPSNEKYASLRNPQSLNLYSYVIDDPLKYVDDLGLSPSGGACTPPPPLQKCTGGNCSFRIYYPCSTSSSPIGNVCAPQATYSLWDCADDIAQCKQSHQDIQDFQSACTQQGNTPIECIDAANLTTGPQYYCPCCIP
jgi:RHS repeat-associated protein